ncbi:hypothetical protein ES332_D01G145400v1 [Gossypium tomentosum]|uniref:Uncharacterized protein n=1 Tax=Gossypium tomentosum TaxID=34277 RepID=A0A5D2M8V4_GOSTO|nr:hypothetical protein ES332_D01G145400v1 [Gossypium tomentosum]
MPQKWRFCKTSEILKFQFDLNLPPSPRLSFRLSPLLQIPNPFTVVLQPSSRSNMASTLG